MKLMELVVPSNNQMTETQQRCLLAIYLSQQTSPMSAAAELKGDAKKMAAGEYLVNRGLVVANGAGVEITQQGANELASLGLVAQGRATQKGQALIDNTQQGVQNDGSREVVSNAQGAGDPNQGGVPRNQP